MKFLSSLIFLTLLYTTLSQNPTVVRNPNITPDTMGQVSEGIRDAITKGDTTSVEKIITSINNDQRQQLITNYRATYSRDLLEDLRNLLTGQLKATVLGCMRTPDEYFATLVSAGMRGVGQGPVHLMIIDVLATRSNAEIRAIKAAYKRLTLNNLETDLGSVTKTADYNKLLMMLLEANRDENKVVDMAMARRDAQALYNAGEARRGTDTTVFSKIFAYRSYPQISATVDEYRKIAVHPFKKSLENEFDSWQGNKNYRDLLWSIGMYAKSPPTFFAFRIFAAMNLGGTYDNTITGLWNTGLQYYIISRSEVDTQDIKQTYHFMYKNHLTDDIRAKSGITGDYQDALINLLEGNLDVTPPPEELTTIYASPPTEKPQPGIILNCDDYKKWCDGEGGVVSCILESIPGGGQRLRASCTNIL